MVIALLCSITSGYPRHSTLLARYDSNDGPTFRKDNETMKLSVDGRDVTFVETDSELSAFENDWANNPINPAFMPMELNAEQKENDKKYVPADDDHDGIEGMNIDEQEYLDRQKKDEHRYKQRRRMLHRGLTPVRRSPESRKMWRKFFAKGFGIYVRVTCIGRVPPGEEGVGSEVQEGIEKFCREDAVPGARKIVGNRINNVLILIAEKILALRKGSRNFLARMRGEKAENNITPVFCRQVVGAAVMKVCEKAEAIIAQAHEDERLEREQGNDKKRDANSKGISVEWVYTRYTKEEMASTKPLKSLRMPGGWDFDDDDDS
jgi:hypothetical protein